MTGQPPSVTSTLRKPRWATCPVCLLERRYDSHGVMVSHSQWVPGFECSIKNCSEDHPYGYMRHCRGSGKTPLADKPLRVDRQKMNEAYMRSRELVQYNPGE